MKHVYLYFSKVYIFIKFPGFKDLMCCGRKDGRKDNVKAVYPPPAIQFAGYKKSQELFLKTSRQNKHFGIVASGLHKQLH